MGAHNDDDVQVDVPDDANDCFFGVCEKKKTCNGYASYPSFKSKSSVLFCLLFATMLSALFTAVIVPLVAFFCRSFT